MSSVIIVEGKSKPDFVKKMTAFGSYALVYTGTDNTMKRRTIPSIALLPSNNTGELIFH